MQCGKAGEEKAADTLSFLTNHIPMPISGVVFMNTA